MRARGQGGALPFLIPGAGQHHDTQTRAFAAHVADCLNTASILKHIRDHDIGLQASCEGDRVRYPVCLTDYLEIGLSYEHGSNAPAKYGALIHENHAQARTPIGDIPSVCFKDARHQGSPIMIRTPV